MNNKNPNQMSLNIEQEEAKHRKLRVYRILVQLQSQSPEGNEGNSVEEVMRAMHTRSRRKIQKDLHNLVRDGNAIARTIANRTRFFVGPVPYTSGRQYHVAESVIDALKDLCATGKNPDGYTNNELHEYISTSTDLGYTPSQVCRATSRHRNDPHIVTSRSRGYYNQPIDRFLWIENPKPSSPPPPAPKVKREEPPQPPATNVTRDRLRAIATEVRSIVGTGFISRELPLTVREEAFAAVDALDVLVDKLS